jgi:SAM-dependent methyltransferase
LKRLVIYAHFDESNKIKHYVLYALNALFKVSDTIIFISTSQLDNSELDKIASLVTKSILTENIGLDFFMWKQGLCQIDYNKFDEIVITNSSVYGPLLDISTVFEKMKHVCCDFWGLTENFDLEWHLQSYFIVFRNNVLRSQAFSDFWESVLPYSNKNQVIRSYEVGLSQWLIGNGFKYHVYFSWRQIVRYLYSLSHRKYRKLKNPSVAYAFELICLGFPFLKLEVLRENPYKIDTSKIISLLRESSYPLENLQLNAPKRTPLKSTPQGLCPLCKKPGKLAHEKVTDCFEFNSSTRWPIRRCISGKCGVTWLDPSPLESEIYRAYLNYYTHAGATDECIYYPPQYGSVSRFMLSGFRKALKLTGIHKKRSMFWLHDLERGNGRLLEIGCGNGSRLVDLQSLGWCVEGQEIDPKAVQNGRAKGLHIHEGTLDTVNIQENTFDVVLLSHVLEHIHRPKEFLTKCRNLLKPGGRLVISTPNVNSFGHKIYRRYWRPLEVPRHIIIYTPRAIENILREIGFSDLSVRTVAINFELISMHSRDIKNLGWTDANSLPRVGNELIPVMMQFIAMMVHKVFPRSGEECFAIAEK